VNEESRPNNLTGFVRHAVSAFANFSPMELPKQRSLPKLGGELVNRDARVSDYASQRSAF